MRLTTRQLAGALTFVILATATLAGPAWAVRPDDRAGMLGVGAINNQTRAVARPDDRAGARGPGLVSITALEYRAGQATVPSRPDDRDGTRGPGAAGGSAKPWLVSITALEHLASQASSETSPVVGTGSGDSFPWPGIGVGAALIALAGLLGTALVINARSHRRPA
jgi:hypothetical protein